MTYTPIPKGTPNWDVPLNAALSQLDNSINAGITNALQAANNLSDLTSPSQARINLGISASSAAGINQFNVKDYGAIGNGIADDAMAIQNAMAAATAAGGALVFFPHGTYLVNSGTGFSTSSSGVTIQGEGSNASQISIGSSFTGTSLFTWTGNYGGVRDLSIIGSSTTTTSNPAAHGVTVSGGQTFRVVSSTFLNINGYAIRAIGTASQTLHGGMLDNVKIQSCAGGVYIISDSTNTAANFMISNLFTRFLGVNSGANANLDGIHIEDSWDVMMQNVMPWMNATVGGTGAALRIKGNCAATFIENLDALGPQTGTNVVIESGTNGDPQNVQIAGGVIQQGGVGLSITGSSNQIRVRNMRILNNQTHNIVVSSNGTGSTGGIYIDQCAISQGGAGAAGTNYDINWTGTAEGFITDRRFGSAITTVGTAGVQGVVNITSAVVRADNINFAGTGTLATNIFPGIFPQYLLRADLTNAEWRGNLDMRMTGTNRLSLRADTASSNAIAFNVAGTAGTDNFRILGDGSMQWGPGNAARDVNMGRAASGIWYTDKNALVGSATSLGDNGVGEIQLANATTVPTTNPTAGAVLYATGGVPQTRSSGGAVVDFGRLNVSQASVGPNMQGFVTWNYDPMIAIATGAGVNVSGTIYMHRVYLAAGTVVTSLAIGVQTAGATLTAAQNLMAIYDASGNRQGLTADQSAVWTSTGFKTAALTGSYTVTTAGYHYIAVLSVGTTPPAFYQASNAPSALFNGNVTGATLRHVTNGTSQTTLPTTRTLSSNASSTVNSWVAAL